MAGQAKLLDSKVLLLGAGGLGSPAALYLAAAGVGTLGIIDMDVVDESNLQRQILHNMDRVGERKVDSAKKTLTALNPDVNVVTYDVRLGADNVLDIFEGYDVIVDGTDNFPTRYLVNDASLKLDIPVVHGSIFRFEGQASVYLPHQGPCYRCQVPEPPPAELAPSCAEAGRARRAARDHRQHPGHGDHQAAARASATRWPAGCWPTTPWRRASGPSRSTGIPECAACSIPKEQLVIAEYDELCMPHPIAAPARGRSDPTGSGPRHGGRQPRPRRNLAGMANDERRTDSGIEIKPVYAAADLAGWDPERPARRSPGSYPYTRGIYPTMYRGRPGRSASTPGSGPPRRPTSAGGCCSPAGEPGCRAPSTCRPRWATTRTIPGPRARSARSGWPSTPSTTCGSCSAACRSTRSPRR